MAVFLGVCPRIWRLFWNGVGWCCYHRLHPDSDKLILLVVSLSEGCLDYNYGEYVICVCVYMLYLHGDSKDLKLSKVTFPIVRMYFSMLNNMETISKTLKWTIICDISQLYSQSTQQITQPTPLDFGRLENKVAIMVMDNATKSWEEII